jgi:hypothetical protein
MLIIPTTLRPSRIHGLGVFAAEGIHRGQIISRFYPPLDVQFTREFYEALPPAERLFVDVYAYRSPFTGLYILPGDHDRFMNHSQHPNVGMNPDGSLTTIALRPIRPGAELTCDYRTFDADWGRKLPHLCKS